MKTYMYIQQYHQWPRCSSDLGLLQYLGYFCSLLLFLTPSFAISAEEYNEYQVKSAYLLHFTLYIDWPDKAFASRTAPFNICTYSQTLPDKSLQRIVVGEKHKTHPIKTRYPKTLADIRHCHVLFIPQNTSVSLKSILAKARKHHILVVGETPGFIDQGGMIGFVWKNNAVRFEINQKRLKQAGMSASFKLLKIARRLLKE